MQTISLCRQPWIFIFLFFYTSSALSFSNPIILNLADNRYLYYGDNYEKYGPCWNQDGAFMENECSKVTYQCDEEETFTNGDLLDLKVNPSRSFKLDSAGLKIAVHGVFEQYNNITTVYASPPWSTSFKVPLGAEVFVYENVNNDFHILERVKISHDGVVELTGNKNLANHDFLFSLGEGWPPNTNISVFLFGKYYQEISHKRDVSFKLPEGSYFVLFKASIGDKKYIYNLLLSAEREQIQPTKYILNFNQFKDVNPLRSEFSELVFTDGEIKFFTRVNKPEFTHYGFESISSVELVNNNTFLTKEFEVKKSNLVIKDMPSFEKLIKDYPVFRLRIKGLCGIYYNKIIHKSYDVFADPNSKKKGVINLYSINYDLRAEYEDFATGIKQDFNSNLKIDEGVFYYQAFEQKGRHVDLGKGIWGASAWIETTSDLLFSSDQIFYFPGKSENELVEYLRGYKGDLYKRLTSKRELSMDSIFYGDIVKVSDAELFNEEGIIKLPIVYVTKPYRNSMRLPQLVDLTNGEISLLNQPSTVVQNLYTEPSDQSAVLGKIELFIADNILKSFYSPTNENKKKVSFTADYYQGLCSGHFKYSSLYNVENVYNEYSQIGSGPWGEKAWVKSLRFDITDKRLPVTFMFNDKDIIKDISYHDWEGDYDFEILYGELDKTRVSDKFLRNSSKIILKNDCSRVSSAKLSQITEPKYISLIPDSLDMFSNSASCGPLDSITSPKVCKPLKEFSLPLFEDSDSSSKRIGEIVTIYDPSIGYDGMMRVFFRKDGVDHKIQANFYGDYCSYKRKHLYLQLVWGEIDGWANLGEGLWGKKAWVNIQPKSIIGEEDFLYYFSNSYYSVRLEHFGDNEILMTDRLMNLPDKKMLLEDILYPDGLMKLKLDCSGGC